MRGLPDHRLIPTESRSVRRLAGRTLDERFEACMIQSVVVGIVPDCKVHQPQVKPRALVTMFAKQLSLTGGGGNL